MGPTARHLERFLPLIIDVDTRTRLNQVVDRCRTGWIGESTDDENRGSSEYHESEYESPWKTRGCQVRWTMLVARRRHGTGGRPGASRRVVDSIAQRCVVHRTSAGVAEDRPRAVDGRHLGARRRGSPGRGDRVRMMTTSESAIGRADLFRGRRRRHTEDVVVRADADEAKGAAPEQPSSVTEFGVDGPDQFAAVQPRTHVGRNALTEQRNRHLGRIAHVRGDHAIVE